jgi:hypothetical protein
MRNRLIFTAFLCGIALCFMPTLVFAVQKGSPFGGDAINAHADSLSQMLFGPIAKIAALFGGVTGVIYGYLQQSVAKMLTFGGIMLVSVALPTFINGFYSMLLP